MRSERFGRLLKGAVGSIATHEGKTGPQVEAELGNLLALSPASIQRYKAGHVPPDPYALEVLATAAVKRGYLNRAWLVAFLQAADYSNPMRLVEQLYPATPPSVPATAKPLYHNLPAPLYQHFVPRSAAYERILSGLKQRSAVTLLVSIGGMGKTSLAREVAYNAIAGTSNTPTFEAAVWISDREQPGSTSLAVVLDEIAFTLDYPGLAQLELPAKRREIERLLRQQAVLVVVDNFESVNDPSLASWLLRLPEPSKALVTSRELHPTLTNNAWMVELGGFTGTEAQEFIRLKSETLKLGLDFLSPELETLLTLTGGNPKAIEVVLGYLKYTGQTISKAVTTFQAGQAGIFEDLFERAWQLCAAQAKETLMALTLFAASASQEMLAATANLEGEALELQLKQLVELALIELEKAEPGQAARYTLHPLVKAYARARLKEYPEFEKAARQRQLEWYLALANEVGYCWYDLSKLKLLDPEIETIFSLIPGLQAQRQDASLLQLVQGIDYYCYIRGLWQREPQISYLRVELARRLGDNFEEARALAYYMQMRCRQNQLSEIQPLLARLAELRAVPSVPADILFEVDYAFGLYWMALEDYQKAVALWQPLLSLAPQVSPRAMAVTQGQLALCYYRLGELEKAQALWQALLENSNQTEFRRAIVSAQLGLTRIYLDKGQFEAARLLLDRTFQLTQEHEARAIIAELNYLYARYYLLQDEELTAAPFLTMAIDIFERLGLLREKAEAQGWLNRA